MAERGGDQDFAASVDELEIRKMRLEQMRIENARNVGFSGSVGKNSNETSPSAEAEAKSIETVEVETFSGNLPNDPNSVVGKEQEEGENLFDLLPNELVTAIFRNCTFGQRQLKCSLICRRFHNIIEQMTPRFFDWLPDEVVLRILESFGIRERANVLAKVCKRFHDLVTQVGEGMSDVYVLNVFEEHIWDNSVSRNNSNKQTIIRLPDTDSLQHVFKYFKAMSAAKIWYESADFGERVIDNLSDSHLKMSCVDVYPYAPVEVLDYLEEKIPQLEAITMRPHGPTLWNGVPMTQMPQFQHLRTLIIDGFEIDSSIKFPPNVTTFDYSFRSNNGETPPWMLVMPKLAHMPLLEFISLSHVRINTVHDFVAFIQFLGPDFLPHLKFLVLKFCKFPSFGNKHWADGQTERNRHRRLLARERQQEEEEEEIVPQVLTDDFIPPVLPDLEQYTTTRPFGLQWLKIELCDGSLAELLSVFTSICHNLTMVLLSVIADLEYLRDINTVAPILEQRRIWTHLSFLTKAPIDYPISRSPFRKILPSPSLFGITTKLEASFADDPHFFKTYLLGGKWHRVHEVKLISCPAASNEFIEHISENAKFLRKLTVIRCRNVDEDGMGHFVENIQNRQRDLTITWKRDKLRSRPSGFYLHMCTNREKLEGKTMRFKTKTFPEGDGEEVVVIGRESNIVISLRDWDENDAGRLVSICVRTPFSERRKEELRLKAEQEKREAEEKKALMELREELTKEPPSYTPPPPPENEIVQRTGSPSTETNAHNEQASELEGTGAIGTEPGSMAVEVSSQEQQPVDSQLKQSSSILGSNAEDLATEPALQIDDQNQEIGENPPEESEIDAESSEPNSAKLENLETIVFH
ncbi:unnamed protein product, partial [Mesorhabditis belari]|uniref:F-box domain-containing protein n=1 Tax=Mesorhabditis belari TaxID=2138241 RepID=A0AAF3ESX8_9BILA